MSMPGPREGLMARARIELQQAVQLLKKNLDPKVFDVHGPEWKAIDSAIRGLSKVAGQEEGKDLSNAGLKLIASSMGPKGMGGPPGGGGGGMPMGGPGPMPLGGM